VSKHQPEVTYDAAVGAGLALFAFWRLKRTVFGAEHLPREGGAVIAITHFGYLDFALTEWIVWLQTRRRIRFMAKQSVFNRPVVGSLLRAMRHIPVDMSAGADAYAAAVEALKAGELIGVFPEAGVSASFTVRDFKTGAVRLAAEADVPLIPVVVWGGHRLMTKRRRVRFVERFGVPVSFAIGSPLMFSPDADARVETDRLHATMAAMVDGLQARYPVDGAGQWWQPRELGGAAPSADEAAAADAARDAQRAAERRK